MREIFRKTIHTTIVIEAPREAVWAALSDFTTYGKWNTLVPQAIGVLALGASLAIKVDLPRTKQLTTKVTVTDLKQFELIRWLGHFWIRGLCDGHHTYCLRPLDSQRTELIHAETFEGLLLPFIWGSFGPKFRQRFNEANAGLKLFVEGHH